tara:strand:+ start:29 stop:541 length:513 start_codon:yes stop_codon:yes gene_type:complete
MPAGLSIGKVMLTPETQNALLEDLATIFKSNATDRSQQALEKILVAYDCVVGTLHFLDKDSQLLRLAAQRGLPPPVLEKVQTITVGKGMAGIAAERMKPVQVCNLQTDDSGVARPTAKETLMEGCISVPMLVEGKLRGVFGVAKPHAYEFDDDEIAFLLRLGEFLARQAA